MAENSFDNVYAVILAGGSGTRFWPKSRLKSPKQLCKIGTNKKTLIELTLERLDGIIPPKRRLIVTHKEQAKLTKKIVGKKCPNILAEPDGRNTANALALAALEVEQIAGSDKNPIMISFHADHLIQNQASFKATLIEAVKVAAYGKLVLIGAKPTRIETGYGYIERGSPLQHSISAHAFSVKSFREKPNHDLAKEYLESGNFLWNTGMFVWQTKTILSELRSSLPQTVDKLERLIQSQIKARRKASFTKVQLAKLASTYKSLPKISIDNAVLEVSHNISAVQAEFDWHDVGSWDALDQCFPVDKNGNLLIGNVFTLDTTNCTIESDGPLIATIGLKDLVVVSSGHAILVCSKSRAQDVKKIVEYLQTKSRRSAAYT